MKLGTLVFVALLGGLTSIMPSTAVADDTAKVRLLYFSSFPEIRQPKDAVGLGELASALKAKSIAADDSFFIHGGASFGPSVLGSMDAGAHMVDLLNALDPAIMAVGKKEFSYGFDQFVVNALSATFPIITSNLVNTETQSNIDAVDTDYFIETPQLNLGFIALTSAVAISEYGARQIAVLDHDSVIKSKSDQLRLEGADAIILLVDTDFEDLGYLQEEGLVDVIFYAHNFDNPVTVDSQGTRYSEGPLDGYLIVLDMWKTKSNEGNQTLKTEVSLVDISKFEPDTKITEMVQSYQNRLGQLLEVPIGQLKYDFDTFRDNVRSSENTFANIVTAAMRNVTGADAAMLNAGSVRGNTEYHAEQRITRGDIQRELPFENRTVVIEITGEAIRQTLEHSINCGLLRDGCFVHFDNITMQYDSTKPAGERIINLTLGGAAVDNNRKYKIVMPSFMAQGNDGFVWLNGAEQPISEGTNRLIWRIVADYAAALGTLAIKTDGRIQDVATTQRAPN